MNTKITPDEHQNNIDVENYLKKILKQLSYKCFNEEL